MNKNDVKKALEIITDAIIEKNVGKIDSEDFYWWKAALRIFDLELEDGAIVLAEYPEGSYADRNRFFTEWKEDINPYPIAISIPIVRCKDCFKQKICYPEKDELRPDFYCGDGRPVFRDWQMFEIDTNKKKGCKNDYRNSKV